MKRAVYIALLSLLPFAGVAQRPLTPEAEKVKAAYDWLMKQPDFPENHMAFIKAFPDNKDHYIDVFTPHQFDQLYFQYDAYLAKYRELGRMYPKQVMPKCVSICKKLSLSDGPAGIMQETMMEVAGLNPEAFALELKKLKKNEQASVIAFLAGSPYNSQYQELIKSLEQLNETKIAQAMTNASAR
ncbi:hypothetical protein [Polluticoccus soli]|uniref:hypothetical protein n=1 Tax=Polluticoccus soli TaxID=3034150 RepID=UPI0023E21A58|nr:hypothetical protein [Flavipsychrobacter sp. JY13-12]